MFAINYRKEHSDLTQTKCAKNLGIGVSTFGKWVAQLRDHDGDIPVRCSGNYASDEQKEIARFKRELRDSQDALDVLKKPSEFWEKLTDALYTEVSAKVALSKVTGRRVSTSGMLKFLGVSRSGYNAFLDRKVASSQKRKASVKTKIKKIYNASKQNYGAPKIARELHKEGEHIS